MNAKIINLNNLHTFDQLIGPLRKMLRAGVPPYMNIFNWHRYRPTFRSETANKV